MRRGNTMQLYLVRFTGPDGEHVAASHSIPITDEKSHREVNDGIRRTIKPATPKYPEGNPDITITEIRAVKSADEIYKVAQEIKDRNPDRPMANELGLDTPNRVLTDPEILRNVAAERTPG